MELLEDLERYLKYERPDNRTYVVTEIFDKPLPGFDNGFFYKSVVIPVKCSEDDYVYLLKCGEWSAQCWNYLVEADNKFYEENGRLMNKGELQTFVKNKTPLHAAGNQHVYFKYFDAREAMFQSRHAKHQNSCRVNLPYKQKEFYVVGWNVFCYVIDYKNKEIRLGRKIDDNGKYQPQVRCSFKELPKHIVEIELIHKDKLYLVIKYKEPKVTESIISDNVAAIDFGEIHSISSIDNNGNAIIITGRKLRDIKRFQNKERGHIKSLRSHCQKDSQQYKKYSGAIKKLSVKSDNQIKDCIHKISKMYLDYCIENQISKVYYGDLDSCVRNTKGKKSKVVNQKLSNWTFGRLTECLQNKLGEYGIEMVKVSEAFTSQTCPNCNRKNKPTNRNYVCKCGYTQHRDLVGAMNILNFNEKDIHIERYSNFKYLRIE